MNENYTLDKANEYIKNNSINKKYYPEINFAAPIGWINDPNGVSLYNDELHLFYQHYPYESVWGPMHWGHAKSKDGLNWEHLPVAIAPDKDYDKDGCFSGSAIEKDGVLYLMYTGHLIGETDNDTRQNQNIAFSKDGVNFEKYEHNPVIDTKDIPEGSSIVDFRDPKVFEHDGLYYVVIGSKTNDDLGQVLLYESSDLLDWTFKSVVLEPNKYLGDMVECPDLLLFENKAVFLLSAMNYTDEETGEFYPHISWLIEGKLNWDTFKFNMTSHRKMDGGFDYYAPQSVKVSENPIEYVAIAWHQAWNRTLPSHDEEHGWAGQMTVPRIIREVDGEIIQAIYPPVLEKAKKEIAVTDIDLTNKVEKDFEDQFITFTVENNSEISFEFKNEQESITINFDSVNNHLQFERTNTQEISDNNTSKLLDKIEYPINLGDIPWEVELIIDVSSIQIFINDQYTFSSTFYTENKLDTLVLSSKGNSTVTNVGFGRLKN